ncbi:MAG: hypothetical protein LBG43_00625 [Treponema sp.]|nr:hypothetical protein [Treponema sp.]
METAQAIGERLTLEKVRAMIQAANEQIEKTNRQIGAADWQMRRLDKFFGEFFINVCISPKHQGGISGDWLYVCQNTEECRDSVP